MAVKLSKLWGDARFSSLSPNAKLLYVYLCTQPGISTLGILNIQIEKIKLDLNSIDSHTILVEDSITKEPMRMSIQNTSSNLDIRDCISILELNNYIKEIILHGFSIIIIKHHFSSLPKSKLNLRKAQDEYNNLDEDLKDFFNPEDFVEQPFTPPTPKEISDYALSKGYIVNGQTFFNYYNDNDWYDKNNKKVRNWKAKVTKVWAKEENKLTKVKGAPKGYEYFYITLESGDRIYPESWKDGKPMHSNFLYQERLRSEFK